MSDKFCGFDTAVVVDVETTGLDPEKERIVSVAMIRVNFKCLLSNPVGLNAETRYLIVNPQQPIPRQASRVHGFTDADVTDKDAFAEHAQQLRDFIGDHPVIAHNVGFDISFLDAEFEYSDVDTLDDNEAYCTMQRFVDLYNQGRRQGSNLDAVARCMKVRGRARNTHDAMEDASLTFCFACQFYMIDNGIALPDNPPDVSRLRNRLNK